MVTPHDTRTLGFRVIYARGYDRKVIRFPGSTARKHWRSRREPLTSEKQVSQARVLMLRP